MEKNFADMTGAELVHAHNAMVTAARIRGLTARTVERFVDRTAGIRRCEALASSLRAAAEVLWKEEQDDAAMSAEDELAPRKKTPAAAPPPAEEENEDVAKKVKKATKAKKNGTAAPKKVGAMADGISAEFGVRPGSLRDKALAALPLGEMIPLPKLIKAVYGREATVDSHGIAVHGSPLLGIKMAIDGTLGRKVKLPYELRKEKDAETKAISYGLFRAR